MLARFWTGWAHTRGAGGKRSVAIPDEKLRTRPWVEWAGLLLGRAGVNGELVWHWRNAVFQRLIPEAEIQRADMVIGFDTASHILARRAQRAGKPFVLEQSILDPEAKQRALLKIASRYPEWVGKAEQRSARVLQAEREEQRLAAKISVPSEYVGRSLVEFGVLQKKIFVNPYGTNPLPEVANRKQVRSEEGCRFLFAGTVTGRKGVPLLLEAWAKHPPPRSHLTIAGDLAGWPAGAQRPGSVEFPGKLTRQAMAAAFQNHDVFVFPSYAEGMPLVVLEAMAQRLPVIATPVTEGLVQDKVNGLLIPFNDPASLAQAMRKLAGEREKCFLMGEAAKQTALHYSWKAYGQRYAGLLNQIATTGSF